MEGISFFNKNIREYIFAATDRFDESVDQRRCVRTKKFKLILNLDTSSSVGKENNYRKQMKTMQVLDSLNENNLAFIHAYDPEKKVQLRLTGNVNLHHNDETSLVAWNNSREMSKLCYSVKGAPGEIITHPEKYDLEKEKINIEDGYQNFGVLIFKYYELEFLYLKNIGHRRSKFTWKDDKAELNWLIP